MHPTELVILNFGNIEYPEETVPKLIEALKSAFPETGSQVKMNKDFKANGSWPLLGEAVDKNERVFVMIRDTVGAIGEADLEFVREIKAGPDFSGQQVGLRGLHHIFLQGQPCVRLLLLAGEKSSDLPQRDGSSHRLPQALSLLQVWQRWTTWPPVRLKHGQEVQPVGGGEHRQLLQQPIQAFHGPRRLPHLCWPGTKSH